VVLKFEEHFFIFESKIGKFSYNFLEDLPKYSALFISGLGEKWRL